MSLTARAVLVRPSSQALVKDVLGDAPSSNELNRLSDTIKLKEKVIEEQMREITTLKSQAHQAQKQLVAKQSQMEGAQERAIQAVGGASASNKELALLKTDKKKLEVQVSDLMRNNAKLKDQLTKAMEKNPNVSHQLAALQSDVRAARQGAEATAEELRGVNNTMRAKDKELARMNKMVEETHALSLRNGELENKVLELSKAVQQAGEEMRTLEGVVRMKEAAAAKAAKELEAAREALDQGNAAHADTSARLKAMTSRCSDLESDVSRLRDENARVGAVAARVAASEVTAGSKDEGTVPLHQHMEEMKYWNAEVARLKDKLAGLEKQLAVADELKNQYRNQAERLSLGGGSGGGFGPNSSSGSLGGASTTPARPPSAAVPRAHRMSLGASPVPVAAPRAHRASIGASPVPTSAAKRFGGSSGGGGVPTPLGSHRPTTSTGGAAGMGAAAGMSKSVVLERSVAGPISPDRPHSAILAAADVEVETANATDDVQMVASGEMTEVVGEGSGGGAGPDVEVPNVRVTRARAAGGKAAAAGAGKRGASGRATRRTAGPENDTAAVADVDTK